MNSHEKQSNALSETFRHREVWKNKPALRTVYGDYYRRIIDHCTHGSTLEIGGGSGNFKEVADNVISLDIQDLPWLNLVADAQQLPFPASSFANIVGVDILHHLPQPYRFFCEAIRTLRPGGRVVLIEPAITAGSYIVYKFLHPEPVDFSQDPLTQDHDLFSSKPFDANQAIPTNLFRRDKDRFARSFPKFDLITCNYFSLLSYLLSGGFRDWSLLPDGLAGGLLRTEKLVEPILASLLGFRLLIVLERKM